MSLSYETAKKLKDAGFRNDYWEPGIEAEHPDLSELIRTCGGVRTLESGRTDRFILWFDGELWHAGYYEFGDANYVDDYPYAEEGSTPEEAVANLYLALKKTQV